MWRVDFGQFQHDPRFGAFFNRVPRRPSWVWATSVMVGVLVVVIPLLLLVMAGLLIGSVTFIVLSLIARAVNAVQSVFGGRSVRGDQGRRNVRVID